MKNYCINYLQVLYKILPIYMGLLSIKYHNISQAKWLMSYETSIIYNIYTFFYNHRATLVTFCERFLLIALIPSSKIVPSFSASLEAMLAKMCSTIQKNKFHLWWHCAANVQWSRNVNIHQAILQQPEKYKMLNVINLEKI